MAQIDRELFQPRWVARMLPHVTDSFTTIFFQLLPVVYYYCNSVTVIQVVLKAAMPGREARRMNIIVL